MRGSLKCPTPRKFYKFITLPVDGVKFNRRKKQSHSSGIIHGLQFQQVSIFKKIKTAVLSSWDDNKSQKRTKIASFLVQIPMADRQHVEKMMGLVPQ